MKDLREGDRDEELNKTVRILIAEKTGEFIVYLDENLDVEWNYDETKIVHEDGWGEVFNRVSLLEAIPIRELAPETQQSFRCMAGEAIARLLVHHDITAAKQILDKAESFVNARNLELARRWYLSAAGLPCGAFLLLAIVGWFYREPLIAASNLTAFTALLAACFGGIGAGVSVLLRIKTIPFDASAGREAHRLDGFVRVVTGVVGGVIAALAIRADLAGGFIQSLSHPFLATMVTCLVAGASERLVPDLIERLEGTFREPSKNA